VKEGAVVEAGAAVDEGAAVDGALLVGASGGAVGALRAALCVLADVRVTGGSFHARGLRSRRAAGWAVGESKQAMLVLGF
jgi:hypothetical protein